ncbi:hypothetical protein RB195_020169 [Necator americanus]|uniref:Uncharacterized protein n=1 Tax=Necator americanus TaxID=51031 RepID=A0ABR1CJF5_NECAM
MVKSGRDSEKAAKEQNEQGLVPCRILGRGNVGAGVAQSIRGSAVDSIDPKFESALVLTKPFILPGSIKVIQNARENEMTQIETSVPFAFMDFLRQESTEQTIFELHLFPTSLTMWTCGQLPSAKM